MAAIRGIENSISEVISFRLNPDNTHEARELRILNRLQKEGHNTRLIVTEALLRMGDLDRNELNVGFLTELNEKLDHVSQILQLIDYDKSTNGTPINQSLSETKLSDGFLNAIKENVRPGMKIE